MKTVKELVAFVEESRRIDSHVHTHLCDGKPEMTVENIAAKAIERGFDSVILTPHFHKKVSDGQRELYEDSDQSIFLSLREEIDAYAKNCGQVRFLLSCEADIVSANGETSLDISKDAERALDAVTLTMNYHPSLPLKFVGLTMGKYIDALIESGEYNEAATSFGGVGKVLEAMYECELRAIEKCQYTSILGHFFAAHSVHPDKYSWFDAKPEHLPMMREYSAIIIDACRKKGTMIDITGVHMKNDTVEEKMIKNGFMVDLQRSVLSECKKQGVYTLYGSDAHSLASIGNAYEYYEKLFGEVK